MDKNITTDFRGEEFTTAYRLSMSVDVDMDGRGFENYLNNLDMWLTENCGGKYNIEVTADATYHIPNSIYVGFEEESDAAFFKLSSMWQEKVE